MDRKVLVLETSYTGQRHEGREDEADKTDGRSLEKAELSRFATSIEQI